MIGCAIFANTTYVAIPDAEEHQPGRNVILRPYPVGRDAAERAALLDEDAVDAVMSSWHWLGHGDRDIVVAAVYSVDSTDRVVWCQTIAVAGPDAGEED